MKRVMNAKNPIMALLGHFAAIGRHCDLCSIDMEDAVRIAQRFETIRDRSQSTLTIMDGWWREFSGYLEGLSVLYSHVKGSSGEDDKLLAKAKELAADGTRTGQQLFDPFGRQLHGLDPPDISMITETAVDLLDTILFKLFALLETS